MRAFDIGYVPTGWERGQALWLWRATAKSHGRISPRSMYGGKLPLAMRDITNDIAALDFRFEDGERVEAWLRWWHEDERMRDIRMRMPRHLNGGRMRVFCTDGKVLQPATDEEIAELRAYDERRAIAAGAPNQ